MLLYFHAKLSELRVTYHEFFRIAYEWKFHKQVDLTGDYSRYQVYGTLPVYVLDFLNHLKEKD